MEDEQNLTLRMPSGANMTLCKPGFNPYPALSFVAEDGPELLVSWMGSTSRFWTTPWAIASNSSVVNSGMTSFTLHNPPTAAFPSAWTVAGVLTTIGSTIGTGPPSLQVIRRSS